MLFDSHLHLDSFEESGDLVGLLERAAEAGVTKMLAVGGGLEANERSLRLASEYSERIYGCVGFDRDEAGNAYDLNLLKTQLQQPEVRAVGETGLDYHYSKDTAVIQKQLFQEMLELSVEFKKPVIVHSREAEDDSLGMLREMESQWKAHERPAAVLHCFTGDRDFASRLLDLNLFISFSGIITFRSAESIREAARYVPLNRLLIETDAPYLAPVPHRGKRNETAYVRQVAEEIAKVKELPVEDVMRASFENACTLFQISL